MVFLETELDKIKGIDRRFLDRLNKLKIRTVRDLIWHFPSRYEDFSIISKISDLEPGQTATVLAQVKQIDWRRTRKRNMTVVEAIIGDETGNIKTVWFNQPYIIRTLPAGKTAIFSGKVTLTEDEVFLSNPAYGHSSGLLAVYPETRGLTSKGLRYLIKIILKNLRAVNEFLPAEVLRQNNLPEINDALRRVHFPESMAAAKQSKKRFAFEDVFLLQLYNVQIRSRLAKKQALAIKFTADHLKDIAPAIPFALTASQKQALAEILNDIKRNRPMNRLLQGDVGSGKTVVAAVAALLAAKNNYQVAFMAPTEVLARQHYYTLIKFFGAIVGDRKLPLGLLTGSEARLFIEDGLEGKSKKPELIKQIAAGDVKIVVGTHALIQKNVLFKQLALAIVDEQHRFGVGQRKALIDGLTRRESAPRAETPHLLSMSATPIPRTLTMTLFGDLDLSLITELPAGRRPIITKIIAPANRLNAYEFIRRQIRQGRQAFVICPRIETGGEKWETEDGALIKMAPGWENDREKAAKVGNGRRAANGTLGFENKEFNPWLDVKAVEEEYKKLSEQIFPDLRVAMLHGRMRSAEKKEVMAGFAQNKINIVVSTSVVEIGVDIPNAAIMMIEDADRFGLAQLYQFRGRVGRGRHQSYCLLFTGSSSASTHRRLKSLLEAKNGFELAEKDLALRGPGQFLGTSQTGLPDLVMDSLTDAELIKAARDSAEAIIKKDPELRFFSPLKERLGIFCQHLHRE